MFYVWHVCSYSRLLCAALIEFLCSIITHTGKQSAGQRHMKTFCVERIWPFMSFVGLSGLRMEAANMMNVDVRIWFTNSLKNSVFVWWLCISVHPGHCVFPDVSISCLICDSASPLNPTRMVLDVYCKVSFPVCQFSVDIVLMKGQTLSLCLFLDFLVMVGTFVFACLCLSDEKRSYHLVSTERRCFDLRARNKLLHVSKNVFFFCSSFV